MSPSNTREVGLAGRSKPATWLSFDVGEHDFYTAQPLLARVYLEGCNARHESLCRSLLRTAVCAPSLSNQSAYRESGEQPDPLALSRVKLVTLSLYTLVDLSLPVLTPRCRSAYHQSAPKQRTSH